MPRGTALKIISSINRLPNLTSLVMEIDSKIKYSNLFTDIKLRKLSIKNLKRGVGESFIIDEMFNTTWLEELTLSEYIRFEKLFSQFDLNIKYPRLASLCLQYKNTYRPLHHFRKIKKYSHKSLTSLTVTHNIRNPHFSQTLCSLAPNFPVASVNWWRETWYSEIHEEFSEKIVMLSPNLPPGVVGDHNTGDWYPGLEEFSEKIEDKETKPLATLKECYTRREMLLIYTRGKRTFTEIVTIRSLEMRKRMKVQNICL